MLWYGEVKDGPRTLRHTFFDRAGKELYDKVIPGCLRYRTLPVYLQYLWPQVFKRVGKDDATGEVLDERTKDDVRVSDIDDYCTELCRHQ